MASRLAVAVVHDCGTGTCTIGTMAATTGSTSSPANAPVQKWWRAPAGARRRTRAAASVASSRIVAFNSSIAVMSASSLAAWSISRLRRRRSSSSSSPDRMSSSVARALSVDPPKKVRRTCCSSERRAVSRGDRRPVVVARPVLLDSQVAFRDEDPQGGADGGIGRRVVHRVAHFGGGGVAAGVHDVEDFPLAPAEPGCGLGWHSTVHDGGA